MTVVTILDTSAASDNVGDEIIMESVNSILHDVFPSAYFYKVATHEYMGDLSRNILKRSDYIFIGGTNILSSRIGDGIVWKVRPWDAAALDHAITLGCGWFNYQREPNLYSRWFLRKALSSDYVHSTRDTYASERLNKLGLQSVNTSCITTWGLSKSHCEIISKNKSERAVFTLTYYLNNKKNDSDFIKLLQENYSEVYFWPQQENDVEYFASLNFPDVKIINPNLKAYDDFLNGNDVDYIGTRLHGGIRALQKFKRSLIIAVDIRATEIARSTNLPVVKFGDLDSMRHWIANPCSTEINLPEEAIATWKSQFSKVNS